MCARGRVQHAWTWRVHQCWGEGCISVLHAAVYRHMKACYSLEEALWCLCQLQYVDMWRPTRELTGRLSLPSMTFCGMRLKLRTTCTGAKPSPARPAASGRTSCVTTAHDSRHIPGCCVTPSTTQCVG